MKTLKKFLAEQSFLWEQRIPTRLPSGKGLMKGGVRDATKDDPSDLSMKVDLHTMKRNRKSFEHNIGVMKDPTVYQDIPKEKLQGSHDEVAEHYIEHFKNNILHLHDTMPEAARAEAKKWYDGANAITKDLASRHGIAHHTASAVVAALSPQNEWNNNVALATRVLDIHHNKKDHPWSPEMEEHSNRIWEKATPKVKAALANVKGKSYNQLSHPAEKAIWIRTHDEAHNPKKHFTVTPSGSYTNKQGTTKWTSVDAIAKSINIIESGGDINKISQHMGSGHKIRNFYNNIQNPHDPTGDVTIDTHAVAAAHLKPFSSNSMEVNHAFGTNPTKKPSNWKPMKTGGTATGINGTDPMYEEAYRRAAKERGILPRQMQSIAWEGVRAIFPAKEKSKGKLNNAYKIWQDHHEGSHDADTARRKITELTGGAGSKKYDW
jgi:hypothetical protein